MFNNFFIFIIMQFLFTSLIRVVLNSYRFKMNHGNGFELFSVGFWVTAGFVVTLSIFFFYQYVTERGVHVILPLLKQICNLFLQFGIGLCSCGIYACIHLLVMDTYVRSKEIFSVGALVFEKFKWSESQLQSEAGRFLGETRGNENLAQELGIDISKLAQKANYDIESFRILLGNEVDYLLAEHSGWLVWVMEKLHITTGSFGVKSWAMVGTVVLGFVFHSVITGALSYCLQNAVKSIWAVVNHERVVTEVLAAQTDSLEAVDVRTQRRIEVLNENVENTQFRINNVSDHMQQNVDPTLRELRDETTFLSRTVFRLLRVIDIFNDPEAPIPSTYSAIGAMSSIESEFRERYPSLTSGRNEPEQAGEFSTQTGSGYVLGTGVREGQTSIPVASESQRAVNLSGVSRLLLND